MVEGIKQQADKLVCSLKEGTGVNNDSETQETTLSAEDEREIIASNDLCQNEGTGAEITEVKTSDQNDEQTLNDIHDNPNNTLTLDKEENERKNEFHRNIWLQNSSRKVKYHFY